MFTNPYSGPCEVTKEYQKVAKSLFFSGKVDPVDPSPLLAAFRTRFPAFQGSGQHDAQEVILCLIDVFEISLGKELIKGIFNGIDTQETIFPGGKSIQKESFTTMILDPSGPTSLDNLISKREKHSGISGYTDDTGKTHHVAAVGRKVEQWPRILGFTFSMYNSKFPIEIPEEFEGRRLFAIVIHQGIQWGGHYALLVRRYKKWYLKDDETVTEVNEIPKNGPFYMAWYRS